MPAQEPVFPIVVRIENGLIAGLRAEGSGVTSFKGIPFAAPPVGALRWKEPQPAPDWAGIRPADRYGPSAMQAEPKPFGVYTPEFLIAPEPMAEDCLYLNIWTGARSPSERRPVIVWIHGGGFSSGGTNVPIYDGTALAERGVVFVSIAYRVGVFGFLAHPDLAKESPHGATGHYGLMDQLAALRWVQRNIERFGGDPANVTVAGQSAGAMSISALAASPVAQGLFQRAIAQSGSLLVRGGAFPTIERSAAERAGVELVRVFGAKSIDDLRRRSAAEILAATRGRFYPVVDGHVLTAPVPDLYAGGPPQPIDLLTGWNADEHRVPALVRAGDYRRQVQVRHGHNSIAVLRQYPGDNDADAFVSQLALSRDESFGVAGFKWAVTQARAGRRAWVYSFQRELPAPPDDPRRFGAFHTAEVPYALGTLAVLAGRPLEPVDAEISERMMAYWVNFARTGDPNGPGLPEWPTFVPNAPGVMVFAEDTAAAALPYFEGVLLLSRVLEQPAVNHSPPPQPAPAGKPGAPSPATGGKAGARPTSATKR